MHTPMDPGEVDDRRKYSDRRAAQRRKILRRGITFWQNGDSTECTVHNLSNTGAQLEICGPVPRTFDLVIDDQMPRSCCIVWRRANRIGVKFQGEAQTQRARTDSTRGMSPFRRRADECRTLATRVDSPDREILLRMANAWETFGRRFQKKLRLAQQAPL
jgi:hypothetical protein